MTIPAPVGPYELPALKFGYGDLAPVIDADDLRIHHAEIHQKHIDLLNDALKRHPELYGLTIEQLLREFDKIPTDICATVRDHGGGHANHQFFWKILTSKPAPGPSGDLARAIIKSFGSIDAFKKAFESQAGALFGSGWCFLVCKPKQKFALDIVTLPNQQSLLTLPEPSPGLLACDMWEHAYYPQFGNSRPDWIRAWWDIVDWDYVEERLLGVHQGRAQL